MAGGTGSFNTFAKDICKAALFCMESSDCIAGRPVKCLPGRGSCWTFSLAREIKKNLPRVYEEWEKIVEKQESDAERHGINAIIIYGLAKIYELRYCVIIPNLSDDLIEKINEMGLSELMAALKPLLDNDFKSLMYMKSEENQIAVLRVLKMFYDGTKQPAILQLKK